MCREATHSGRGIFPICQKPWKVGWNMRPRRRAGDVQAYAGAEQIRVVQASHSNSDRRSRAILDVDRGPAIDTESTLGSAAAIRHRFEVPEFALGELEGVSRHGDQSCHCATARLSTIAAIAVRSYDRWLVTLITN